MGNRSKIIVSVQDLFWVLVIVEGMGLIHYICGGWAWVPAVVDLYLFNIYILMVNLDDVSLSKRRKTCLPGA
jgi:hypothetical protein